MEQTDQTISFREIVLLIIRKMNLVLIFALVTAIAAGGYCAFSDYSEFRSLKAYQASKDPSSEEAAKLRDLKLAYDAALQSYTNVSEELTLARTGLTGSLYMQINPQAVRKVTLTLSASGLSDPAGQYFSSARKEELFAYLKDHFPQPTEISYLKEIVSFPNDSSLAIIQKDEESCNELAALCRDFYNRVYEAISPGLPHTMNISTGEIVLTKDDKMSSEQQARRNKVTSLEKNLKTYSDALPPARDAYEEYNGKLEKGAGLQYAGKILIYTAGGLVGGLAVVCVIVIWAHVSDNKVRSEKQFGDITGIRVLGSAALRRHRRRSVFDRLADRLSGADSRELGRKASFERIYANLLVALHDKNVQNIMLTGSVGEKDLSVLCDGLNSISAGAKGDSGWPSYVFDYGTDPGVNAVTVLKTEKADAAVVVARYDHSEYREVACDVSALQNSHPPVCGAVIII